jgi:hypothetical protein
LTTHLHCAWAVLHADLGVGMGAAVVGNVDSRHCKW